MVNNSLSAVATAAASLVISLVTLLALGGQAGGDDAKEKDREARAKAAIAFTAPGLATNVAPAPRAKDKLCTDATCNCAPGTKGPASTQIGKALTEHRIVVVFYGGTPARCCTGILVGVDADVPAGVSEKLPIVIYAPSGAGAITPVASLPKVATNEEISTAIRKAQAAAR